MDELTRQSKDLEREFRKLKVEKYRTERKVMGGNLSNSGKRPKKRTKKLAKSVVDIGREAGNRGTGGQEIAGSEAISAGSS